MRTSPRLSSRRGFLRVAAWNLCVLAAGLAAIAGIWEAWIRLTHPFADGRTLWDFHPEAGILIRPGSEIRRTDHYDHWQVSRANSLGFPDREPIDPGRAAASCHIAVLGDSLVAGLQVPLEERLHVVLEARAAAALPDLDVTAQAWARPGSGQIEQLPYYDEFARTLRPKLVLLVFVRNDFISNAPLLLTAGAWRSGWRDPDRLPFVTAGRSADGGLVLRPPAPPSAPALLPLPRRSRVERTAAYLARRTAFGRWAIRASGLGSWRGWPPAAEDSDRSPGLAQWLRSAAALRPRFRWRPAPEAWTAQLARRPAYARILAEEGENLRRLTPVYNDFIRVAPPGLRDYALAFTAFALDEFKRRADRDGAALAILPIAQMGGPGAPAYDAIRSLAAERGIPVIDQFAYMAREGLEIRDLRWRRLLHWNAAGHRNAAGAVLEWLARNRHVCGRAG